MTAKKTENSFAESLEELEKIVSEMEKGGVDLEASLASFERGLELAETCKKRLGEVENKIIAIKKKFGVATADMENGD